MDKTDVDLDRAGNCRTFDIHFANSVFTPPNKKGPRKGRNKIGGKSLSVMARLSTSPKARRAGLDPLMLEPRSASCPTRRGSSSEPSPFSVGLQSAHADIGGITLVVYKGGWLIGGSAGHGTLNFHGRSYRLDVGGIDYVLLFGGSRTMLWGRVSNIWRPSDVAGVYGAAGAGLALGVGVRGIVLVNQKGAVLQLSGRQIGLMANADLSGLAIMMR